MDKKRIFRTKRRWFVEFENSWGDIRIHGELGYSFWLKNFLLFDLPNKRIEKQISYTVQNGEDILFESVICNLNSPARPRSFCAECDGTHLDLIPGSIIEHESDVPVWVCDCNPRFCVVECQPSCSIHTPLGNALGPSGYKSRFWLNHVVDVLVNAKVKHGSTRAAASFASVRWMSSTINREVDSIYDLDESEILELLESIKPVIAKIDSSQT